LSSLIEESLHNRLNGAAQRVSSPTLSNNGNGNGGMDSNGSNSTMYPVSIANCAPIMNQVSS